MSFLKRIGHGKQAKRDDGQKCSFPPRVVEAFLIPERIVLREWTGAKWQLPSGSPAAL